MNYLYSLCGFNVKNGSKKLFSLEVKANILVLPPYPLPVKKIFGRFQVSYLSETVHQLFTFTAYCNSAFTSWTDLWGGDSCYISVQMKIGQ